MGGLAETQLFAMSLDALVRRDGEAGEIIARDKRIDALDDEINASHCPFSPAVSRWRRICGRSPR